MNRIKALRKKKCWSQEELGKLLGVSQSTIAMWETGSNMPSNRNLLALSKLFGKTVDYLIRDGESA